MSELSQAPEALDLRWRRGDPVSLSFTVAGVNWSGSYVAQIRTQRAPRALVAELTVSVSYSAPDTAFVLSMTEAASLKVPAGTYDWDLQVVGGVTRLAGAVTVDQDVSS